MKILITGATGFFGSHLVKALLQEGHRIAIIKRPFSNSSRISSILSQITSYDPEKNELSKAFFDFDGFDAVIHTATCYGRNGETSEQILEANTFFPLLLLRTASDFSTRVFINTDTILNKYINSYALSKKQFAEWGKFYTENGFTHFINIQLAQIYGPDKDESKFPTYVVANCLRNIPELNLTAGEQKRDFIYIRDAVNAYLKLLQHIDNFENYTEIQLGSGSAVTIRKFVETVHQMAHSSTFLHFGALPYRKYDMDETPIDIRALIALGWSNEVTLQQGIKEMINFLNQKAQGGDIFVQQ